ncbi:sel1 repeat family protein [Jiella sp. MQZ13P-4]|uniref:Sel1 repeat family protein n=2 Tax=Jiella sonneratiae TaxID=2816856 RepID=A0ABS3J884_9HYPH|nr:sel1 repeat family protein [Jiella sonneratiae]
MFAAPPALVPARALAAEKTAEKTVAAPTKRPDRGAAHGARAPSDRTAEAKPAGKGRSDGGGAASSPSKSDMAYGAFQRGYYLTAVQLAEPLANIGDPAAQTLLGEIYSRGLGVKRDMKEAARWYEAAAKAGNAEAQFRYAMILLAGTAVKQDEAQARDLMKAAADAGLPLAEYNFGQMLIESSPAGGFADAASYFEKAANAGVPEAQYAMSQLYANGKGVAQNLDAARSFLHAAALNGFDIAQIEYGIWLINGKGGPAKPEEGFLFLRHAAELGNPIAVNRVAHLYKDGIGTAPDVAQAAKWAVLAKRMKNSDAVLDDFFRGLDADAQKSALEAANRFRSG